MDPRAIFFPVFGVGILIVGTGLFIDDLTNFEKLFNEVVDLMLLIVEVIK